MERMNAAIKRSFMPSAILAAIYVNAHLKPGVKEVTPDDFIPGEKKAPVVSEAVREAMKQARLNQFVEAWGGPVKK